MDPELTAAYDNFHKGKFSSVTASYTGKGVVRYAW